MKTLYFECNMGAAGDMLMASLLELHSNPEDFLSRLNGAGIPNVAITAKRVAKCGITGNRIEVKISESSHHGDYPGTKHIIDNLKISDSVKKNALEVYRLIATAESHVHGVPVDKIHFHEVGEMDAIADITGVCMLIEELAPDLIFASPVNTGSGHIRCAHGVLPVPAPATAHILQGAPMYSDGTQGELCTPTGAALLKHFAREFRSMPVMAVSKIGYGMGTRDFERANCLRVYFGESSDASEKVSELACNLDDMTPEAIAFAQALLLKEGALDVYTTQAGMKKGRMGLILTCLCRTETKDKMLFLIFKHTTTIGIREYICRRYVLQREQKEVQTEYGIIRVKTSHGFGVEKSKPEYEDIARLAIENDISFTQAEKIYKQ